MTFLEIVQMTVQQTGTIQGVKPTAVTGQQNRLKLIVDYVREAYIDIQNAHRTWHWLNSRFTGPITVSSQRYAYDTFSDQVSGDPITRFSEWAIQYNGGDKSISCYKTSIGTDDEGAVQWLDWDRFYDTQLRGVRTPGRPHFYSIDETGQLMVSPIPDDTYTLRGRYIKSPQILAADGDIPEMPTQFHTVIKDAALQYVEGFDEGPRIPVVRLRMLPNWSMLEMHQLPRITWGTPLA
jgi:hypothetical protein